MTQKIFIYESNSATFVCPECHASKTTDVGKYRDLDRKVSLKIKCTCGNSYSVVLERRRHFRKETNFPGIFFYRPSKGQAQKGSMSVLDISRGGLKIEFVVLPKLAVGSIFEVEFALDDKNHTVIKKEVVVRKISENTIGAEFCSLDSSDPGDKALGFYLF